MQVIAVGTGPIVAPIAATYTHPASTNTEQTIVTIATIPATRPQNFSAEFSVGALITNNTRLREYRSPDSGSTWVLMRTLTFNAVAGMGQAFTVDMTGWQLMFTIQTGNEAAPRTIPYRVNFR